MRRGAGGDVGWGFRHYLDGAFLGVGARLKARDEGRGTEELGLYWVCFFDFGGGIGFDWV